MAETKPTKTPARDVGTQTQLSSVLEHYKKTFWYVQAVVALAAFEGWHLTHRWTVALTFVGVMEVFAVFGAAWAIRIKRMVQRSTGF